MCLIYVLVGEHVRVCVCVCVCVDYFWIGL